MPDKVSPEQLRASLEDLVHLAERLAPHCSTTEQLVEVARLALTNDGQFSIVMSLASGSGQKR
jgi:hypothetical protein